MAALKSSSTTQALKFFKQVSTSFYTLGNSLGHTRLHAVPGRLAAALWETPEEGLLSFRSCKLPVQALLSLHVISSDGNWIAIHARGNRVWWRHIEITPIEYVVISDSASNVKLPIAAEYKIL